ncbi:MAG: S8 family peptidase [Rhodospirillaceae bacterium]|nr:S8 family peptidase [Rhodospirillaceae bacterium]
MASPVQIVLNPENYDEAREAGGGGPKTDFFAFRDDAFRLHKTRLIEQLEGIARALERQPQTSIGHAKVILRKIAWAKSHRPVKALFTAERTPVVGGGRLGVLLVEMRPETARAVAAKIYEAEETTTLRFSAARGKDVPHPSARRSEAGAIEKIELFGPSDRRSFSIEEALVWLANPMTGGSYQVELFEVPPPRSSWDAVGENRRLLYQSFVDGLTRIGRGLDVGRTVTGRRAEPLLSVRLGRSEMPATLRLGEPSQAERRKVLVPFNSNRERHTQLLGFLETHPLVRHIDLPGIVVRSPAETGRVRPDIAEVPTRNASRTYPLVGVIDGGISPVLADWVVDRWDFLADADTDASHGTFIGGLAVMGGSLNGTATCPEPDGALLVDVDVFPNDQQADSFASYYPSGLPDFFGEVESAVSELRARQGVRMFNMSLNIRQPAVPARYSEHASRLDAIADANDVLIFISAGNTEAQNTRTEWQADPSSALAHLAAAQDDGMLMPAESVRNVAVSAVNPPGLANAIAYAPSRYSRRGPGLRTGVKPDLAHVGGSGSPKGPLGHGLFSVAADGTVIDGCGTSYSTPLVAKTAAALDHAIEGEVSRETLVGLLVHHAQMPEPLRPKVMWPVARHLVGFGIPQSADRMLEGSDHEITLVFASRLRKGQQMNFRFQWPTSLVGAGGKCRGAAKLTLVSTPPLDQRFGDEFVRVNVDASLQQEKEDGGWEGRLDPIYLPGKGETPSIEAELIEHGLKWSPVKAYAKASPRGVGKSPNWRLTVGYLTRVGEEMREEGVPFTAILTIADLEGTRPVFNDLRQSLLASNIQIADIRTAARVMPRV